MRLLNTTSIELEQFIGNVPRYAILSHRWEDDEVLLEDMKPEGVGRSKKGYRKLQASCALAAQQGLKYIWIDTCCIDKTSSADLSEAVNSMFRYYKEAEVCYTYLSDVDSLEIPIPTGQSSQSPQGSDFYQSTWFTRGWTLQELIAPKSLRFYNKEWGFLGTKTDLKDAIEQITKIPAEALLGGDVSNDSVSRKMSWASSRKTTVPEDIAYCLLGLFSVNIPLLYGEGEENAFLRLQEAIIKSSDDDSIFLWRATLEEALREPFWGLLAKSPTYFLHSQDIPVPCTMAMTTDTPAPATMTGRGLNVEFLMTRYGLEVSGSIFLALFFVDGGRRAYAILMQKLSYSGVHFARVGAEILFKSDRQKKIDCTPLHRRALSDSRTSSDFLANGIVPDSYYLEEPQTSRLYVRQNPKLPSVMPNETGVSFDTVKSLPPGLILKDRSSGWYENSDFFLYPTHIIRLDFEPDRPLKSPIYLNRDGWMSEFVGTLRLSDELVLLVGHQKKSAKIIQTPLVCQRPWCVLVKIPNSSATPDQILKKFASGELVPQRVETFDYRVSFDLQRIYGQVCHLIKITERKREQDIVLVL